MNTERTPAEAMFVPADGGKTELGAFAAEANSVLFPAMEQETPATRLLARTIESFKAEGLTPEVAVAMALNLATSLACDLVAAGAPRGKVVNTLPTELRNRLQRVLPLRPY